jgi:hypothetical protein
VIWWKSRGNFPGPTLAFYLRLFAKGAPEMFVSKAKGRGLGAVFGVGALLAFVAACEGSSVAGEGSSVAGEGGGGSSVAGGGLGPTGDFADAGTGGADHILDGACAAPPLQTCDSARCPTSLPPEATTCAPDGNECGCNGGSSGSGSGTSGTGGGGTGAGLTCDPSRNGLCIRISQNAQYGVGGPGTSENICAYDLCAGDADCPDQKRCFRSTLGLPVCSHACRFDSECTKDCGGQCMPRQILVHGVALDYSTAVCVYSGACGAESCANCLDGSGPTVSFSPPQAPMGMHTCD